MPSLMAPWKCKRPNHHAIGFIVTTRSATPHARCRMHFLVGYFQPWQHRTALYHEVLVTYMGWLRRRGYTRVCLWVCPPTRGTDYIFWRHPETQRTPGQPQLGDWYHSALKWEAEPKTYLVNNTEGRWCCALSVRRGDECDYLEHSRSCRKGFPLSPCGLEVVGPARRCIAIRLPRNMGASSPFSCKIDLLSNSPKRQFIHEIQPGLKA